MSRRVYEVAREMGLKGKDLAVKINTMSLSFSANNHMSTLTEDQEDELHRALERQAREDMIQERISATVIRRKHRKERVVPTPVPSATPPLRSPAAAASAAVSAETTIPPMRPTPVSSKAAAAVPAETQTGAAAVRRRKVVKAEVKVDEVEIAKSMADQEAAAEAAAPTGAEMQVPQAEAVPDLSEQAVVAKKQAIVAIEELAVQATSDTVSEPSAVPRKPTEAVAAGLVSEPVETRGEPEEEAELVGEKIAPEGEEYEEEYEEYEEVIPIARPARDEVMAALAKKAVKKSKKGPKTAQVVGALSPELLQQRLAVDKKSFGPTLPISDGQPPTGTRETFEAEQAGRRKRKRGKKVYGAAELYDRRTSRRRVQKKPVGGQATKITVAAEHKRVIKMEEAILVGDLARQMGVKAGEIALKLMMDLGIKGANINTPLDFDAAGLIAEGYGYSVEQIGFDMDKYLPEVEESGGDYEPRPPVVTVMGHVDHGKTCLLDAIRATDVAAGEHGGITQHIGAYKVRLPHGTVVFLDTPGHEAFTALRARGAQATDIVVLVVAADDGVMPQTVEAINHAKDAEVPIVVAINKIDKEGANPDRVMQALAEYALLPESWGGETLFQLVSAKEHIGIEELLDAILLQAEMLEIKANPTRPSEGIVIESRLDIGRGPIATVLIQQGTLETGEVVVIGGNWGRIRALSDERGNKVDRATPSTPVEITGLDGVPEAGETMYVVADEKAARAIADHISEQKRQKELAKSAAAPKDLEALTEILEAGELKEVKLIIKADVQGSVEALVQALTKLTTEEIKVKVVHAAVGGITETDVNLAASSTGATLIVGFNIRPESRAMQAAEQMGIAIQTYTVIYDVIDAVKNLMQGLLEPVYEEHYLGRAEVRETFSIPKVGMVAGCYVLEGRIIRGAQARVLRNSRVIYQSSISSLRRFKDDVKEVKHGFECGLSLTNFNDIKLGDIIETFEITEVAPTL